MNRKNNPFKSPFVWTLAAGAVIGAASVMSFPSLRTSSLVTPVMAQTAPAPVRPIAALNTESMATLKALDESFATLSEVAAPAVVHIKVDSPSSVNMLGEKQAIAGEGSGFIFRPDGYIITNDHVVDGFEHVKVILHDGREFNGKVTRAQESDIAVVKIDAKDLPTLPFADSSKVRPGEFALAIGAPFGLDNSVTIGHVSATGRVNAIPDGRTGISRQYGDLIQTDAQINMGNSGGPLINVDGQVIGINTAIFSTNGMSNGIGFAIAANEARFLADTLIEKGKVERSYLGVNPEDLKEIQKKDLHITSGAYLSNVQSDSPAAMAGIKQSDVVVRVGSVPVNNQADLRNAMFRYAPGSKVDVEVIRDGQHKTFEVKLGTPKPPVVPTQQQQFGGIPHDFQLPPGFKVPDIQGFGDDQSGQGKATIPDGKPRLGVGVLDINDQTRKQFSIPSSIQGAVVGSVTPGSIADQQLNMQPGDVIQQYGDLKITNAKQLSDAVKATKPGEKRTVQFRRYNGSAVSTFSIDVILK